MNAHAQDALPLPVRGNLKPAYAASLVIAALMGVASIAGLLSPSAVYPTDELSRSFVPNDVVNLLIGLPILLGSMVLAARGQLLGLLFWPGALFYVFYTYLVYIFCMPLDAAFLLDLLLVTAGAYAMIGLLSAIDAKAVRSRLAGAVPERLCGGVLAGLGALFFLRIVGVSVGAILDQTPIAETELALNITDFMISPAWIIGGVLLWRRNAFGYVSGLGLLFSLSMLFIGLIVVMLLQPFLTAAPFALDAVLVIAAMGMICFVPFALFVCGVLSKRNPQPAQSGHIEDRM